MAAALVAACVSGASAASAQTADLHQLPEPAREATPAPNPWTFSSDAGLIIFFVKPDKVADFEAVLAHVKETLLKSDVEERRRQAEGWKVFKSRETGAGAAVLYVAVLDPVAKNADYSIGSLLREAPAAEGAADPKTSIAAKYLDVFSPPAINILHLTAVTGWP